MQRIQLWKYIVEAALEKEMDVTDGRSRLCLMQENIVTKLNS